MKPRALLAPISLFAIVALLGADEPPKQEDRAARWEKDIAAIEKRLSEKKPPEDATFFVGSSSIVRWDVAKSFPKLPVVKVGFGGSEVRDSTLFARRIIVPHRPKRIVFYAGDNDLGAKRTPQQVLADFEAFVKLIHSELPKTEIVFLTIKPSPKRIALLEKQKEANALIKKFCDSDNRLRYLDLFTPMLDSEGKPKPGLYAKDELHLSPEGYDLWNERVQEVISK
jgi:lysophospholipase L1-like esterase